ncbi:MAG: SAM-dependent methyltransferase [Hyphomicrobiales bacterium]|nr:SAM-dependent methyltransferase [Hyphomicrobiales bacterium]
MSGFSADWLALREAADMRARAASLIGRLRLAFADRAEIAVADIGCGTGSTVRAVAPALGARQRWRLYDHDRALLSTARERLSAWAQEADDDGDALRLVWYGKTLIVTLHELDLRSGVGPVMAEKPDILTASALFDLVSPPWIERFAQAVEGAAVYAALTYDGREEWSPPHPDDARALAAFHAHQRTDKGFGPAAGPDGATLLAAALERAGRTVETAYSPWRLGADDAALIAALANGAAGVALELGGLSADEAAAWAADRRGAAACVIGHTDLLAL